jgi:hypothetical protein
LSLAFNAALDMADGGCRRLPQRLQDLCGGDDLNAIFQQGGSVADGGDKHKARDLCG